MRVPGHLDRLFHSGFAPNAFSLHVREGSPRCNAPRNGELSAAYDCPGALSRHSERTRLSVHSREEGPRTSNLVRLRYCRTASIRRYVKGSMRHLNRPSGWLQLSITDLFRRRIEPIFKPLLAELGVLAGHECALVDCDAEVARLRIGNHLAQILV